MGVIEAERQRLREAERERDLSRERVEETVKDEWVAEER